MACGDVERVFVHSAVVDAAILIGRAGEHELKTARLVEDLETGFGSDQEVS